MKVRESRGVSSIVVTSTAHAEGKTLTAFNLAYCCAQLADTPVLLVDADLRAQGLTALTGNQEQFGLRDVLGNGVPYANAVVATDVRNLYLVERAAETNRRPNYFPAPAGSSLWPGPARRSNLY